MRGKGKAAVMTKANAPLEIKDYPLSDVEKGWILVKKKMLYDLWFRSTYMAGSSANAANHYS